MQNSRDKYIPALGYSWLTSLYDPVVGWTIRESAFKTDLLQQANIRSCDRVLDLGCGTATLTIAIKQAHPKAEIVELDCDPTIIKQARTKAQKSGTNIALAQGFSYDLPYDDNR
jgi:ubiquinone/menaquinone biosynthesis C-methylase UbiE